MNCVYSRQDNREVREILGSDEDNRSAKLFVYIRKDRGLFSIHTYLVTKDDKDVLLYTQSNLANQCFKKIKHSLIQVEA